MKKTCFATWNIGSLPADDSLGEDMQRHIRESCADFLCLQEIPIDPSVFEIVCRSGNYQHYRFLKCDSSHIGSPHDMGIAIFSREEPLSEVHYRLRKPAEKLRSREGKEERIHEKYFLELEFSDLCLITGHGFPLTRYCRLDIDYAEAIKTNWYDYCMTEHDYAPIFEDLERRLQAREPQRSGKPMVIGADFNLDHPIQFMSSIGKTHYDVFEGEITRDSLSGRNYKRDALIVPNFARVEQKTNLPTRFDHHLLFATVLL